MPEFVLDHGTREAAVRFAKLDSFTQGYIEAMFFTETGTGDDGDLENATVAELADIAMAAIVRDCEAWQADNAALLARAYERDYDAEQAGRDYWLTRNGHGVGFWDRDALTTDDLGKLLSAACRYSPVGLYRGDDGQLYCE